jgi:4-amino-4-deoxy-L-arabinose transferase-like glycosyltransferase
MLRFKEKPGGRIMAKRLYEFFKSDARILLLLGIALVALHTLTNGKYGFHRDELQTLDDARHLDWGFVAYPPITPFIARLELALFGTSLAGFRFFAAVAVSAAMVIAGFIAKELEGGRSEQLLAAVAAGIAPVSLLQGAVLQYVSFDYLWGVTVTYLLVRLLKSGDPRWWVPIGAVLGVGMETRYTMGFLALGTAMAVLLSPARGFLRSGWLWAGVGLSLLLFLPNIIWQMQHHFISLDFLSHLHARDLRQGRYRGFHREQLFVVINPVTVPLTLMGLWFYVIRPEGRKYRLMGWLFVVTFVLFSAAGARSYYTMPLYPVLLAGGCVLFGILVRGLRARWARLVYGAQWTALIAGGVVF